MDSSYNENFWFEIDKNVLKEILERKNEKGGHRIAYDALESEKYFINLAKKYDSNTELESEKIIKYFPLEIGQSGFGNNIGVNKLSTKNLRAILFLIFREDSKYGVSHVKDLFENLSFKKNANIQKSFNVFFTKLKLVLKDDNNLKKYDYNYNVESGFFFVSPIKTENKTPNPIAENDDLNEEKKDFKIKISKFISKIKAPFLKNWRYIAFVFIVFGIGYYYIKDSESTILIDQNIQAVETSSGEDKIINDCYFHNSKPSEYKILIVPFKSKVTINNVDKDVGAFIEERLEKINERDSLGLNIFYCTDFKYDKKSSDGDDSDYYRRVMNEAGADQIIYGKTQDVNINKNVELTKVRLGYCTNLKEEIVGDLGCDNQYDYRLVSLANIFNGELLENVETLIYWNMALSCYSTKEYDKTIEYINITKDNSEILYRKLINLRSNAKAAIGLFSEAIEDIDVLLKNPKNDKEKTNLLISKGINYSFLGSEKAITYYEEAKELEESSSVYNNIAMYKMNFEENYEESLKAFNKAIALEKRDEISAFFYNSRGMLEYRNQQFSDALESCEMAIKLNPYGHCQWFNKATNLYALGELDLALEALYMVIKLNPNIDYSYVLMGKIYESYGNKNLALNYYKKAYELNPYDYSNHYPLVRYYSREGKFQEAIWIIDELLKVYPNDVSYIYNRMNYYNNLGCSTEAKKDSLLLQKLSPTIYIFYFNKEEFGNLPADIRPQYDSLSGKPLNINPLIVSKGPNYDKKP